MKMRKSLFILGMSALFALPFASNAAQTSEAGTTISKASSVSNEFRPKKKKKKRHGGCEAYGGFAATKTR